MDFRKITFGKTDAKTESEEFPILQKEGYFDYGRVVDKVLNTTSFLFLGYKGSGKSSLSEHLKLSLDENYSVDQQLLKDFPYKSFAKIVAGNDEYEVKAKFAWRWLLLVKSLYNLIEDREATHIVPDELENAIAVLTQSGVFPITDISTLVKHSSTKQFKVKLKTIEFIHTQTSENAEISLSFATEYIKKLITGFKESHTHYIVIDGLDEILTSRGEQYISISALVNEAKDLNTYFRCNNVPIKIIVLCRTDIFERLPDPNKNKIKRDNSYTFSWYTEGQDKPNESPLIELINIRGRLIYPNSQDVISTFFPKFYKDTEIYKCLLDFTRHTPRDVIQLMNSIQNHCTLDNVSSQALTEGFREYSVDYFLPEIKDEMAGYVPSSAIDPIVNVLSSLRNREFEVKAFISSFYSFPELKDIDPFNVLRVLYDCSAIGHLYDGGGKTRVTFKYRNYNSAFNKTDRILLHKGLWKALNINY